MSCRPINFMWPSTRTTSRQSARLVSRKFSRCGTTHCLPSTSKRSYKCTIARSKGPLRTGTTMRRIMMMGLFALSLDKSADSKCFTFATSLRPTKAWTKRGPIPWTVWLPGKKRPLWNSTTRSTTLSSSSTSNSRKSKERSRPRMLSPWVGASTRSQMCSCATSNFSSYLSQTGVCTTPKLRLASCAVPARTKIFNVLAEARARILNPRTKTERTTLTRMLKIAGQLFLAETRMLKKTHRKSSANWCKTKLCKQWAATTRTPCSTTGSRTNCEVW